MKPTYEDLLKAVEQLKARIQLLEEENAKFRKENAELKEHLGLNSSNSSKPPNTDQKKNKLRPKGGTLKEHKGHFRKLSDRVDKHITSKLSQCQYCGSKNLNRRTSQFFDQVDLPEINPLVTRIEYCKYRCQDCGRKQVASFPEGYDKTSFGPKLISFISLCSSAYRMSKRTTEGLLKSLLNIDIALGSLRRVEGVEVSAMAIVASLPIKIGLRTTIIASIATLSYKAKNCCEEGDVWKACLKPLLEKWKILQIWENLGVPPDPYWD